jgi:PAS domain S-box-containing protein
LRLYKQRWKLKKPEHRRWEQYGPGILSAGLRQARTQALKASAFACVNCLLADPRSTMTRATRLLLAASFAIPAGILGFLAGQNRRQIAQSSLGESPSSSRRLRESEERYRTLFNSIDEGFCIIKVLFDAAGKAADYQFLEVNPSFEKQTGLSGAQGKWMRELAPEHEDHWFEIYGHVARTGEPIRFENRAEQLQRWFDVYAFRYGSPELHQVAILFTDINARRLAEQEVRDAARRKDQFLAMLAHELRNPLAPIRNAVKVLRIAGDQVASALPELLAMMERQLAHMARLLDDLLDVSRITRGTIELRKERTDLRAAIQLGVEANRPLIESMEHSLAVSLPADPLCVYGDPARLVQIFSNLLNNAATHSPAPGRIDVTAELEPEWVVLRVRDSGVGIRQTDLQRVFGLFVQVGSPSARQQGGLGIGLSLVQALVGLHGGTITAHSQGLDCGSEFVVRLPAVLPAHHDRPALTGDFQ